MRLILVGAGRVGLAVLESWSGPGDEITLVETDPSRITRARRKVSDIHTVEGTATDEKVLRGAGAMEADALIVATPDDPTNLMVCALARRLGVRNVVARVNDPDSIPLFVEMGATPIQNPSHLTAEHLYHAFEVPGVRAFMPVGEDAEVVTLVLNARSDLANVSVKDANFPRDALLVGINRAGRILVPTADLVLQPGDALTLVTKSHLLDQVVGTILGKPGRRIAGRVRGLVKGTFGRSENP